MLPEKLLGKAEELKESRGEHASPSCGVLPEGKMSSGARPQLEGKLLAPSHLYNCLTPTDLL